MKKILAWFLIGVVALSLAACGTNDNGSSNSQGTSITETADSNIKAVADSSKITGEYIEKASTPSEITKRCKTFRVVKTYSEPGDAIFNGMVEENILSYAKEIFEMSTHCTYSDGYVSDTYFSNDPRDLNYYMAATGGKDVNKIDKEMADEYYNGSLVGYYAKDISINEVREENGTYVADITVKSNGEEISRDTVTIDPATGFITRIVSVYSSVKGSGDSSCTIEFDYSDGLEINYTAKTENGAGVTEASSDETSGNAFSFDAEEINGNSFSAEDIKGAKLIMLNYWEPWCGPCVKEMPDLQKLYENYKDKGLVILGIYSSFENQPDAEAIVSQKGITYPILKTNSEFDKLAQDYYPATFFMDGEGNLITEEPYAGARSYEEWEAIVHSLLN